MGHDVLTDVWTLMGLMVGVSGALWLVALVLWVGWGLTPWHNWQSLQAEREAYEHQQKLGTAFLSGETMLPWAWEQSLHRRKRLAIVASIILGLVVSSILIG